ncbi:MAG: DUF2061 domain-containing protein [Flavobacteriaceae bacterium]|nr:DUF2061 domain-containing protein [Bacteroidia bacterium]MBT8286647.1 DUF2061 domain-containing protein [Bacteroidia bacterium]NNF75172.1 DUF2061 domain-containing protein [Flavobacteriaceae bacterium]NNK72188.1 DUF2061 domain-containing protein [Flavobacteriaceae bacterium]
MAQYKTESHFRSLAKGISWRIIATADTILVVLFVTCLSGGCSLENAIKIGLFEFLIKLGIYYVHERIWQRAYTDGVVTKRESLYKSLTWRLVATTTTFIISGAVLERFDEIALYIALTELFTKFVLFYFHERLWLRIPLGKIRRLFIKKQL